ncbi:hypothetical protein BDZ89DRAFT_1078645 [Hymenopellis radicata]|nr:hypothetical protein BDZ89DRAFT_1078645 [Hymenopellis radicata]
MSVARNEDASIAMLTGPHLLGMFLAWWLLGILTMQAYLFDLGHSSVSSDRDTGPRRRVRWFVFGLVAFEWLQTALVTYDAFHWFVYNWGNDDALNDVSLIWLNVPLMSSVISCSVQIFFAWQIRTLSGSCWVPGLVTVIAVAHACTGIVSGIKVRVMGSLSELDSTSGLVTFTHIAEAVTDIIISLAMSYHLLGLKTGIRSTDNHISRLVLIFMETGIITSTVAVLDVIFFSVFPPNTIHDVTSLMLPKLYTNALLAVLNNRVLTSQGRRPRSMVSTSFGITPASTDCLPNSRICVDHLACQGPSKPEIQLSGSGLYTSTNTGISGI